MGSRTPRRSCDFCYRRKIKCDEQRPQCSHCIAHSIECTFTAPSRKFNSSRRQAHADLEERFQHLEAEFHNLTKRLDTTRSTNSPSTRLIYASDLPPASGTIAYGQATLIRPAYGDYSKPRGLPELQHISPVIEDFLRTYNIFLPLFDGETLRNMVRDFYVVPERRTPVVWAAIHVVLALTHRLQLTPNSSQEFASECQAKAQSVLQIVILKNIELLNIQVLIGMVHLLQGVHDLQPALILIGTTIRLAHRLGLHDRAASSGLSPELERQRACVFWLAYVLDKDLSIRSSTPSVQQDDDIDLDLPLPSRVDGDDRNTLVGDVSTESGNAHMNYFLCRIQLAVIEGGIYDYLLSTRSKKRSLTEREGAVDSVRSALKQWKATVPPEFGATAAARTLSSEMLPFFRILHACSLSCAALIAQASACVSHWVSEVRLHARVGTKPRLAAHWHKLVEEGRDLLLLFEAVPVHDSWNFWTTAGSQVTAVMFLATNAMSDQQSSHDGRDGVLVDTALKVMDRVIEDTNDENLRMYREACIEIVKGARQKGGLAARPQYDLNSLRAAY